MVSVLENLGSDKEASRRTAVLAVPSFVNWETPWWSELYWPWQEGWSRVWCGPSERRYRDLGVRALLGILAEWKWNCEKRGTGSQDKCWLTGVDSDKHPSELLRYVVLDSLRKCDTAGVDLSQAILRRAYLRGVDLRGAILRRTSLIEANLRGASLVGMDLGEANLIGAYLAGADLTAANLKGAKANDRTIWPEGFDPEAAGVEFVGDGK